MRPMSATLQYSISVPVCDLKWPWNTVWIQCTSWHSGMDL